MAGFILCGVLHKTIASVEVQLHTGYRTPFHTQISDFLFLDVDVEVSNVDCAVVGRGHAIQLIIALLFGHVGWLACGPIALNGLIPQPLTIHFGDGIVSIFPSGECHKSIALGRLTLSVHDDFGLEDFAKF